MWHLLIESMVEKGDFRNNLHTSISSVVEFYRWWVRKSKIFGQELIYHQGKFFRNFLRGMSVCQKLSAILVSKVVQKLSLEKIYFFLKNGLLNWKFFLLIFDFENCLWKYDFGTFWRTVIHKKILWVCWFLAKSLAF